jgi:hypothetical protein
MREPVLGAIHRLLQQGHIRNRHAQPLQLQAKTWVELSRSCAQAGKFSFSTAPHFTPLTNSFLV